MVLYASVRNDSADCIKLIPLKEQRLKILRVTVARPFTAVPRQSIFPDISAISGKLFYRLSR